MLAPAALALCAALPGAPHLYTWGLSMSGNTSGGLVSIAPGQASRPSMNIGFSPSATLGIQTRRLTLNARYNLSLSRRFELTNITNTSGITVPSAPRFLVLHSGGADATWRLPWAWSAGTNVALRFGEVDIPALLAQQSIASGQTTTPTDPQATGQSTDPVGIDGIISTISVNSTSRLGGKLSREYAFSLGFKLAHTRPLSATSGAATNFLPTQTTVGGNGQLSFSWTSLDSVSLTMGTDWATSSTGGTFTSYSLTGGYQRKISKTTSLSLNVGALYIDVDEDSFAPEASVSILRADTWSPAFAVAFATTLITTRALQVTGSFNTALTGQQNPTTASYEPRITASLGISARLPPDWSMGLNAALSSPGRFGPYDSTQTMGTLDASYLLAETRLSVNLPVTYRVSDNFSLSAGASLINYAPRFGNNSAMLNGETLTWGFQNPSVLFSVAVLTNVSDTF